MPKKKLEAVQPKAEPQEVQIDVSAEQILQVENERLWEELRAERRKNATLEAGMNAALGEVGVLRGQIDELAKEIEGAVRGSQSQNRAERRRGVPEGKPKATARPKGQPRAASGER